MGAKFRLVHISDLHFGRKPNRLPSPIQTNGARAIFSPQQWIECKNWHRPATHSTRAARALSRYLSTEIRRKYSPDALIISGDLAATGSAADLCEARLFFSSGVSGAWFGDDAEPRLYCGDLKLHVVPGNHDRYSDWLLAPGGAEFESIFSEIWSASPSSDRVSKPLVLMKENSHLALLSADFSLREKGDASPPSSGYIGRGRAYEDVISALLAETMSVYSHYSGEIAVIWVVHFPPNFPDANSNLKLLEEENLIKAASSAGVRLLLAGHTHEDHAYDAGDGVFVNCVGSATQADSAAAWHFSLLELEVESMMVSSAEIHAFRYVKSGRNNFVKDHDVRQFFFGSI